MDVPKTSFLSICKPLPLNAAQKFKTKKNSSSSELKIIPIQDGLFWGCSSMRGQKYPSHWSLLRISYKDETWHSYALPKGDPKIYESRDTPL